MPTQAEIDNINRIDLEARERTAAFIKELLDAQAKSEGSVQATPVITGSGVSSVIYGPNDDPYGPGVDFTAGVFGTPDIAVNKIAFPEGRAAIVGPPKIVKAPSFAAQNRSIGYGSGLFDPFEGIDTRKRKKRLRPWSER